MYDKNDHDPISLMTMTVLMIKMMMTAMTMMMTVMTMMMMRERVVTISAHVSTLPGTAATYLTIMIIMWRPCCCLICVILEKLQI